jgi:hypothetical protein
MGWFTGWIESIAERVVNAHMSAIEQSVAETVKSAQPEIDYDRLVTSLADNNRLYAGVATNINLSDLAEEIDTDSIEGSVLEKVDIDDVARNVADNVDTNDIAQYVSENFEFDYSEFDIDYSSLANEVDNEDLAREVKDQIEVDMNELAEEIDYEALAKALVKLASKSVETA